MRYAKEIHDFRNDLQVEGVIRAHVDEVEIIFRNYIRVSIEPDGVESRIETDGVVHAGISILNHTQEMQ